MLLTAGLEEGSERAVAARSADRSFALIYLPSSRVITVDLRQLAGPCVAARWYDPANGQFLTAAGSPFDAAGPRRFGGRPRTQQLRLRRLGSALASAVLTSRLAEQLQAAAK